MHSEERAKSAPHCKHANLSLPQGFAVHVFRRHFKGSHFESFNSLYDHVQCASFLSLNLPEIRTFKLLTLLAALPRKCALKHKLLERIPFVTSQRAIRVSLLILSSTNMLFSGELQSFLFLFFA